ncbi:MAG: hypothetical protein ACRD8Z_13695 [Nitrososphaeraceae archaeon]
MNMPKVHRMTPLYKELAANAARLTKLYKKSANSTENDEILVTLPLNEAIFER